MAKGAASAINRGIQKKIHGSRTTTLIISNEEMNDIMKIVQDLKDSNILLKGVTKRIKNQTKEPKGGFLGMLLGTLEAILLGNMLARKGIARAGCVSHSLNSSTLYRNKKGKEIVKAGFSCRSWKSSFSYENKKGKRIVKACSGGHSLSSSTSYGKETMKRNCESCLWKRIEFLMLSHPLTNFEIQNYYQSEPRFNGVYSRNNLPEK